VSDPSPRFRIYFIPGVKPKPPADLHRHELLRCLLSGLRRACPHAASALEREPERFELYAWNYDAYGEYRDIALDIDGIDQLLASPEPSAADKAEIRASLSGSARIAHVLGDRFPPLGRMFAADRLRESLSDTRAYLRNLDGIGTAIREGLKPRLLRSWAAGERLIVIGHSLGSVIAYDAFWDLSHESDVVPSIDTFVTLGSPLATRFVGDLLKGAGRDGPERYPTIIRHWLNFAAIGETVALFPTFPRQFREMLELGLVEKIEDHRKIYNHFRGARGLNVHVSYGYLAHETVARAIGDAVIR
jgi:hypothetical protein